MRTTYGYDAYRGRSRGRTALTVLAVILAVVLVLAVAFFLLAQRYIVYTDDGKAHVEFPFFQQEDPAPTPAPMQSQDIVIITPEPSPTPTPVPETLAVLLPRAALTDGTAQKQVETAGGNAALFDMKADDGTLGYVSAISEAVSFGASAAAPGLNDAIGELTAGELYTIARVSCFRDDLAPKMSNRLALRSPVGNWRDELGLRWMSPAVPDARAYVIGICKELCELGFDEILLDSAAFPADGKLENIITGDRYDPENLTGPVSDFYAELQEAMEDYPDVKVSVTADEAVLIGTKDHPSGLTRDVLSVFADGLYAAGDDYGGLVVKPEA